MKSERIEHIIAKRFNTLGQLFKKILLTQNAEDIRLFRVEVKKIKAFLSILSAKDKNASPVAFPDKIEKFYKAVGEIRSFQLQHQLVSVSRLPNAYLIFLTRKIKEANRIAVQLNKGKLPSGKRLILSLNRM